MDACCDGCCLVPDWGHGCCCFLLGWGGGGEGWGCEDRRLDLAVGDLGEGLCGGEGREEEEEEVEGGGAHGCEWLVCALYRLELV